MKNILNNIKKTLNIVSKFLLVILVFVFIINLFLIFTSTKKERIDFSKINKNTRQQIYGYINNKKLNSTKEGAQIITLYRIVNCVFIGEACTNNPSDGDQNYNNSILGYVAQGIAAPFYYQPASGIYWVSDTLQNNNFIPKIYASEGIGFSVIKPLSGLWKIFRNLSYLILVIILITIGFMIMFRVKLNPQTVIGLENSLPRIVLTLLLITFSFPIAGFMIDLMYIVMAIGIVIFAGYINIPYNLQTLSSNGWSIFDKIFDWSKISSVGPAIFQILPASTGVILRVLLGVITLIVLERLTVAKTVTQGGLVDKIADLGEIPKTVLQLAVFPIVSTLLAVAAPLILSIVVFLTALVICFRIFFMLFKSYIKILLLVIFSPLMLLLVAIPGQKMFSIWLKQMFSNLIAFPIVSTLIVLSSVLLGLNYDSALWKPPFLYSNQDKPFILLVSIGILFLIPDIVKALRGAIGIKEGALSTGAGLFFGGAGAAVGTALSPLSKYGSLAFGLSQVRNSGWGQRIFGKSKTPPITGHPPPSS